jgi:dolichol-phosphate mannosyltransferase
VQLLIAIPVYNEEKYLGRVLEQVKRFHPDILVIDDGSTDGTSAALAARSDVRVIRHATNQGYGRSLIDAFRYAADQGYDWVITMDCDEQHEPEMIPEFIRHIALDRWDIISGSRYLQPRRDDDLPPGERRMINANLTTVLNDLFQLGITDAFCGYKAHRVSAMQKLPLTETGYAFPMQFWPQSVAAGLRITEIPVRLIYNDPTRHFGGKLDDAGNRLRHYLAVLHAEVEKMPVATRPSAGEYIEASGAAVDAEPCPCGECAE